MNSDRPVYSDHPRLSRPLHTWPVKSIKIFSAFEIFLLLTQLPQIRPVYFHWTNLWHLFIWTKIWPIRSLLLVTSAFIAQILHHYYSKCPTHILSYVWKLQLLDQTMVFSLLLLSHERWMNPESPLFSFSPLGAGRPVHNHFMSTSFFTHCVFWGQIFHKNTASSMCI